MVKNSCAVGGEQTGPRVVKLDSGFRVPAKLLNTDTSAAGG